MSTAMLEHVETTTVALEAQPGEGQDHVVCHCDLTKGWCGAEIEVSIGTNELFGEDCPTCEAMSLEYDEVCPYGCACMSSERYWHCGIDDMNEDEEDEDE